MLRPGAYVPDATEGIVDVTDFPVPTWMAYGRNHQQPLVHAAPRARHLEHHPLQNPTTLMTPYGFAAPPAAHAPGLIYQ